MSTYWKLYAAGWPQPESIDHSACWLNHNSGSRFRARATIASLIKHPRGTDLPKTIDGIKDKSALWRQLFSSVAAKGGCSIKYLWRDRRFARKPRGGSPVQIQGDRQANDAEGQRHLPSDARRNRLICQRASRQNRDRPRIG